MNAKIITTEQSDITAARDKINVFRRTFVAKVNG